MKINLKAHKILKKKRNRSKPNQTHTTMNNLPPEIINHIASFTGEYIIPFSLTCKNLNQILKADVEKFRYEYDPFYKFDINDIEYWYTLEELEKLEDFQKGKIKLIITDNGDVLGYNKEKDVYYFTNIEPGFLAFDF
jgi:hypothetical protein